MKIDFQVPTEWAELNERLTEALGVSDSPVEVRGYQGIKHALTETLTGLAKLYPLKKKVLYMKHVDPTYVEALTALAKEGYSLLPHEEDFFSDPNKVLAAVEKDTLCVLYSLDDPFFGRKFSVLALRDRLSDESVQQVVLSHAQHFYEGLEKNPKKNSTFIYSLNPKQAFSIVGERARIGSISAAAQSWPNTWDVTSVLTKREYTKDTIFSFEGKELAGCKPFFTTNTDRVWDRAVIYWTDMDGYSFIDCLAKKLKIQLLPPGGEERLETTSLSRWGGVRTMDWLKNWHVTPEMVRGMVLVSSKLLNAEFEKYFLEARTEILKAQYGNH